MPDSDMEARHIAVLENIRNRLLRHRAAWEERAPNRMEAIRFIAALDQSLAMNDELLRLARGSLATSQDPRHPFPDPRPLQIPHARRPY